MEVRGLILFLIFTIIIASSTSQMTPPTIDEIVIREKIDRVGKVQDGGAEDLEKVLSKGINEKLKGVLNLNT